jgi:O-antigen/teichoic acid export membrane protein
MFYKINSIIKKNRSSVMKGSIWTVAGFGSEMMFRMMSSLILTRIFLPEIFGTMAIVTALLVGMEMISEVGVRSSLIQNPRGKEAYFFETAWTVQIFRGFILWLLLYLFTVPLANYFDEPLLKSLLPIASLALIFKGFASVHIHLYTRELGVKKLMVMKILMQTISLIVVVALAFYYKSIWAIVIGSLCSALLQTILSFLMFPQPKNRLRLDKSALQDIFNLGKWLLLATIFHFLIAQGDRLILGGFMTKTDLGLYNLAAMFTQIPISILIALSGYILMPFLSKSFNDKPEHFSQTFNGLLNKILRFMLPLVASLAVFGNSLIQLLYPSDFHLAGQILQLLAISSLFQVISFALIPVFLSRGDSFRHMLAYLSLLALYLPGIYLGFKFYGMWGAFYGMFIAKILWLPIIIILVRNYVTLNLAKLAKKIGFYFVFTLVAITIIN